MSCPFCGYPRSDGMQTHSFECEWCTLQQRLLKIDGMLTLMHGSLQLLASLLVKESHGKPEDPEPDTKRSERPRIEGAHFCAGGTWRYAECKACNPGGTYPDASPAESPGEAPASAEPAANGSERPG